ncbi:efflux RND transporter periplasmic adaptor subunit [Flavihumibacter stibioxidans]|uniref:Efflux transporter periplasmic adaptor subunit n=1 Tax=Flavihumibacter stibioxidans TaxID=1834163 RepID=A0ABR7M9F8_9BACT|nr:efflux RND transporter periplasmic adaptor subunit [Flavihumibacter stibioxidans]MBC6491667.1 efflux transporter periplasmic adaptor subunit [Flavihumibacter stibioxidans]
MQTITKQLLTASTLLMAIACGTGNNNLDKKKAELKQLKETHAKTAEDISKLEKEIMRLDPNAVPVEKPKLVVLTTLATAPFTHYIDLQGKIDAENISYVTPRGMGGQVKAIFVKQGDPVGKGKLLLKLDDAVIRQQIETAKTQLAYAKNLYQRQQNLWDQNIGTEVQLITAKNNVDQAERQVSILNEQLTMTNVYAEVSGIADEVNIKVGETFTGSPLNGIRIVNTSTLKTVAQVPENYLDRVKVGNLMQVTLPDIGKTYNTKVSVSGKLIDPNSRSFYVEGKMPSDKNISPNQIAKVRIEDYTVPDAITIPVNTLQNDEKGKFVLVAVNENGKMRARKRTVTTGELYGEMLEIHNGLKGGDVLITEGYQSLYDGQLITVSATGQ